MSFRQARCPSDSDLHSGRYVRSEITSSSDVTVLPPDKFKRFCLQVKMDSSPNVSNRIAMSERYTQMRSRMRAPCTYCFCTRECEVQRVLRKHVKASSQLSSEPCLFSERARTTASGTWAKVCSTFLLCPDNNKHWRTGKSRTFCLRISTDRSFARRVYIDADSAPTRTDTWLGNGCLLMFSNSDNRTSAGNTLSRETNFKLHSPRGEV